MKPNAIAEHNTTPMGWKTESTARRKRRFCGRNSSVMVVSIGMLPPTPKPTKAVRTRKVLYVLEAPRQRPKMEEKRHVRLKAHLLPVGASSSQSQWTGSHAVLIVWKLYSPIMSLITPQKNAPAVKPALKLVEMFPLTSFPKPSSCCSGLNARPKACAHNKSSKYPNPQRHHMYHWYLPMPMASISRFTRTHFWS